jgi:hypothetical protein
VAVNGVNANLHLDRADAETVVNSAETWEKVIVKLRTRAMPPPGNRRPDAATYDAVASWLESELDRATLASPNPGRPPSLHRLNRAEYANAIRDLFALEIDGALMLPADDRAYGFDNNADALSLTPALMDRYLTAAAKISRLAVGDPAILPAFERYTAVRNNPNERTYLWQSDRLSEDFPLGSRGGIAARHYFPVDGEYVFRVRLERTYRGMIRGLHVPTEIEIRVDGVRVGQFSVGGPEFGTTDTQASGIEVDANHPMRTADSKLEVRVPLKAGMRNVVATIMKTTAGKPEGLGPVRLPVWSHDYDGDEKAELIISALFVGGPYSARVSDSSPTRQRIFVCYPASAREEAGCATKILATLARRAYRRPTTGADVQTLMGFFKIGRSEGDFDSGIAAAIERLLVSPDFLYRVEADPEKIAPNTVYRLTDIELASRLSFFLWSSIPDDELLSLAERGRLREPAVLEQQVRRMLSDSRTRAALVDNFFGQWLELRNVWLLTPDINRKFPWFDDNLRTAFIKETELFLDSQLREDRSVVELLTANYTFLNEQLARHYGIRNVYGSHFRRVTLSDENRWGLLGKGSVLAVTSYAHRTSPTIRGKWLLENILAAPMPPPPPNVNTNLDETQKSAKPTSVREMLEQHRSNSLCASCHARMDPLGFGLENFDGIGQWRTKDAGQGIDASGVLLDGTKFEGPAGLRRALVERKEQFVTAVTGKLLTYALGRHVEYYDAPAIRAIVRGAAGDDFRWSSVIVGIVKSTPFQMRRSRS